MQDREKIFREKGKLTPVYVDGKLQLTEQKISFPGNYWLNYYHTGWSALYLDKKEFALHLSDEMEKRFVYLTESRTVRTLINHGAAINVSAKMEEDTLLTGSQEDMESLYEPYYEKISELRRRISVIDKELEETLKRHEDRWDFKERFDHDSFYTSRELWIRGELDAKEYAGDEMLRSFAKSNITYRAFQEKSNLEYQIRQLQAEIKNIRNAIYHKKLDRQNQQIQAQLEEMQNRPTYISQVFATISAQAEVIYYNDRLMAIYMPEGDITVSEISAGQDWDLTNTANRIFNIREIAAEKAESLPLMKFLISKYGKQMQPMHKIPAKPVGLTDEEWKIWISLRGL